MKKMLILGSLLLMVSSVCFAAPTLNGPTGLIEVPSSDSLQGGEFDLALHHVYDTNVLTFSLGLTDSLEAGVSAWKIDEHDTRTGGFFKYTLIPESSRQIGLAIGGEAYSNYNSLFVVGSKYLSELGARSHFGFDTSGDGVFFAGLSKNLNTKSGYPKTIAMAELYGGDFNVGLRILLTNDVNLDLSLIDLDEAMIGLGFHSSF